MRRRGGRLRQPGAPPLDPALRVARVPLGHAARSEVFLSLCKYFGLYHNLKKAPRYVILKSDCFRTLPQCSPSNCFGTLVQIENAKMKFRPHSDPLTMHPSLGVGRAGRGGAGGSFLPKLCDLGKIGSIFTNCYFLPKNTQKCKFQKFPEKMIKIRIFNFFKNVKN